MIVGGYSLLKPNITLIYEFLMKLNDLIDKIKSDGEHRELVLSVFSRLISRNHIPYFAYIPIYKKLWKVISVEENNYLIETLVNQCFYCKM